MFGPGLSLGQDGTVLAPVEPGRLYERAGPLAESGSFSLDFEMGTLEESPSSAHVTLSFAVVSGGVIAAHSFFGRAEPVPGKASLLV